MSLAVRVDAVSPSVWDAYVTGHHQGSLFHLQGWSEVVWQTYRLPAVRLTAHRGDALLGGVTLYQAVGPYGDRHLTTLPYSAYRHALLADDETVKLALVEASRQEAQRRRCRFVELKEAMGLAGVSGPLPVYGHYSLSLAGGVTEVWRRARPRARNQTRRAQEAGLDVTWEGGAGLGEFYRLYAVNLWRLGAPAHSRRLFESVFGQFPAAASLAFVRSGGEAVAAALLLRWRGWMGVQWAASRREALPLRPNNLLYWSIIERACAEGLAFLDLGRSPLGSGPAHFKLGWGATEFPLAYVRLRPDGRAMPPLNPASVPLRLASALWRRLPLWLAARCGAQVARRLP